MDSAQTIRDAVAKVAALRLETQSNPTLHAAITSIKRFQAQRFAGTYSDLLNSQEYGKAARFFLEELYSEKDYSLRDAQFARIANALQSLFPNQVVATAVALAQLHSLTEELDHQMAIAWSKQGGSIPDNDIARYVVTWRTVARAEDRARQLDVILLVGAELNRLTRTPGLRLMLKMMRRPAMAAGLGTLQSFLESGFDTFAGMPGKGAGALEFLETIRQREKSMITHLFTADSNICAQMLATCFEAIQS